LSTCAAPGAVAAADVAPGSPFTVALMFTDALHIRIRPEANWLAIHLMAPCLLNRPPVPRPFVHIKERIADTLAGSRCMDAMKSSADAWVFEDDCGHSGSGTRLLHCSTMQNLIWRDPNSIL
jgi:hypothetical protein